MTDVVFSTSRRQGEIGPSRHGREKTSVVWHSTMRGSDLGEGLISAHSTPPPRVVPLTKDRLEREERESVVLAKGATRSKGAGRRRVEEAPDRYRTCFERDRDRIVHSRPFRRLAGKTQVFWAPLDHQRTRLTHVLEVAQISSSIARATGLNVALTEAIALGHDCGHGPGGHAAESVFDEFLTDGFHHATFGRDIVLAPLNLCAETLDGIGGHSWSQPAPMTPEGEVVSWSDRIAYCAHDFEDARSEGIVGAEDLPVSVLEAAGSARGRQIDFFVNALIDQITSTGVVAMAAPAAAVLADLRSFNFERIYNRSESRAQNEAIEHLLASLVTYFATADPEVSNDGEGAVLRAVRLVAEMTDRGALDAGVELLGFDRSRLYLPPARARHS